MTGDKDASGTPWMQAGWHLPENLRQWQYHLEDAWTAIERYQKTGKNTQGVYPSHIASLIREAARECDNCLIILSREITNRLGSGSWHATGRRGNLDAASEQIPSHYWRYAKIAGPLAWKAGEILFRHTPWFDVIVFPFPLTATSTQPGEIILASSDSRPASAIPLGKKVPSQDVSSLDTGPVESPVEPLSQPKKKGRTGGYIEHDRELLTRRLDEVIQEYGGINAWQACGILAQEAKGGGTEDAKQKRLHKLWKAEIDPDRPLRTAQA
jgi:hypothetical protein